MEKNLPATGDPHQPAALVTLGVVQARAPAELVTAATAVADALAGVIKARNLASNIAGRRYVRCEGWTTLAAMLGVTAHEVQVTEQDGVFTAIVELRRLVDGQAIARASAECGAPDEVDRNGKALWSARPRYARRSMALTRATAKACRLAFSWVMTLAGYEPAPAEDAQAAGPSERPAAVDGDGVVQDDPGDASDAGDAITSSTPFPYGKLQGKPLKDWPEPMLKWGVVPGRNFGPQTDEWQLAMREELRRREAKPAIA